MQLAVAFAASSLFSPMGMLKMGMVGASMAMSLTQKGKEQGKLNDLRISCSTYGRGIPIVWGTMRVTGNMFWATQLVEHKHKYNSAGKNKDKKGKDKDKWNTVYEYTANFAMGLCEGPIEQVIRVWADSYLIYDKFATGYYDPNSGLPYDPNSHQLVRPGFTHADDQSKKGKKKGNSVDGNFNFRFYTGSEEQMPDPFMVAKQGASQVPAHRGLCYLMFEDFSLADFGNRIPTITAEVAYKKRPLTSYGAMQNLPNPPNQAGDTAFFDYQRQRLYHVYSSGGNRYVRVFDLQAGKEIRRVNFDDMGPDIGKLVGITGTGDIVGTSGAGNSVPMYIIDGNSLTVKQTIGAHGNSSIGIAPDFSTIGNVVQTVPAFAIDVNGNSHTITLCLTQFLDFLTLDSDNQPLNGTNTEWGGGLSGHDGRCTIGGAAFESTITYLSVPSSSGTPMIWQLQIDAEIDKGGLVDIVKTMVPQPGNSLLYMPEVTPDDWGISLTTPVPIYGAECVGVFEIIQSNDPARNGVWAVKLNPFSQLNEIVDLTDTGFDPSTRRVLWRAKVSNDSNDFPNSDIAQVPIQGNEWSYIRPATNTLFTVDWRNETCNTTTLPAGLPGYVFGQIYYSANKSIIMMVNDGGEYKWVQAFVDRVTQVPLGLKDLMLDVCRRANIDTSRVDTSKLNDTDVMGFLMENPTSGRSIVEDLSKVFMFDVAESDYTLKFVSRGQAPIVTIPQDDLGIVRNDDGEAADSPDDHYKETRMQEIDLPMRVNVSYVDPSNNYQTTSAHYKRPNSPFPAIQTKETVDLNLPMALTGTQAKQMAYKALYSAWMERTNHEYVLPWTYAAYDPTDVALFQMNDGLKFTDRFIGLTIGADFSIEARAVSQWAASYSSNVIQSPLGGIIIVDHPKMPTTRPIAFDIPYLDDDHVKASGLSFYWGMTAYSDGYDIGSVSLKVGSNDEQSLGVAPSEVVWGTLSAVVPPPPYGPYATDDKTRIVLFPGHEFPADAWESIQPDNWPSLSNTIVIGSEIIHFRDVEVNADGTVTISHMIRAARGTEAAAYNHQPGERWALVSNYGSLFEATQNIGTLGQKYVFKAYSPMLIPIPQTHSFTMTGASEKPYAPQAFKRTEAGGDITLTWQRRTRYDGAMIDGTGTVPLNEEGESYEVYLLSSPYDPKTFDPQKSSTYLRAFTGLTTNSVAYTAAMMAADGKQITDPVHLVAFQISAKVGRGFPGWRTLEHRFYPNV